VLHRLLALRPLLFHACVPSDFEFIRRDRVIRAAVASVQGAVLAPRGAVDQPPSHVRFWPGSLHGPIPGGRDRIERQRRPEGLRILRVRFRAVLQRNPARECHVGFFGAAGSDSCVPSDVRPFAATGLVPAVAPAAAPRLQSIHAGRWNAADVQEVAFTGFVDLPLDTLWADTLEGPWQPL
jgi:hypothetical protein